MLRGGDTVATAINDAGEVAGRTDLSQRTEAVALLEQRPTGPRRGVTPPGRGRIDNS
ncbi:MAG TPA: hypothetical protein VGF81_13420 [Solirubrobacteraceae bacterium]